MLGDSECTFTRERRMGGWLTVHSCCLHAHAAERWVSGSPHGRKVDVWLPLVYLLCRIGLAYARCGS